METSQQIARLEERLAWLQRHVVEQDKAMLEMSDDIIRLRRELHALKDRQAPGDSSEPGSMADERPPHY
ncbi:MAG: SlyX family protein [Verrucomicrobia bacterium]|nr:SlyX family protein [Verrucomicrobiota bacterium]